MRSNAIISLIVQAINQYVSTGLSLVQMYAFITSNLPLFQSITQSTNLINKIKELLMIIQLFESPNINQRAPPITKIKENFKNGGSGNFTVNLQL